MKSLFVFFYIAAFDLVNNSYFYLLSEPIAKLYVFF